jgi:hypothetical protein
VLPGRPATVSVTAWSLLPMSYQWQKGAFIENMVDIPGATLATYTMPSPTLADHLTLLRCVVTNAAGNTTSTDEMLFVTASPAAPKTITSTAAAYAQPGVPFAFTITSSGGTTPIAYTASPLPAGLSLNPATGVISGTPVQEGETDIAIGASNAAGHASATLTLTVTETLPPVSLGAWRFANFGASAIDPFIAGDLADPDGDGYPNLEEFIRGSNPLDPTSIPTSRRRQR